VDKQGSWLLEGSRAAHSDASIPGKGLDTARETQTPRPTGAYTVSPSPRIVSHANVPVSAVNRQMAADKAGAAVHAEAYSDAEFWGEAHAGKGGGGGGVGAEVYGHRQSAAATRGNSAASLSLSVKNPMEMAGRGNRSVVGSGPKIVAFGDVGGAYSDVTDTVALEVARGTRRDTYRETEWDRETLGSANDTRTLANSSDSVAAGVSTSRVVQHARGGDRRLNRYVSGALEKAARSLVTSTAVPQVCART
jgi:hypothetical protein